MDSILIPRSDLETIQMMIADYYDHACASTSCEMGRNCLDDSPPLGLCTRHKSLKNMLEKIENLLTKEKT